MNKKLLVSVLALCVVAVAGYLFFSSSSGGDTVNKTFLPYQDIARDDTLLAVELSQEAPLNTGTAKVEAYEHSVDGVWIALSPKYAGSSIRIEKMDIDLATSQFAPTGVLWQGESTEDYVMLLHTTLPEGGPQLRVTVTHGKDSAVYEPVYDGSDETSYPVARNGYVLKNTVQ